MIGILYDYFNWKQPKFIHLPLLLNPDKSKLSKRQGDVHVEDFLKNGYIVDAILNYVALLGWHPSSNDEIFSLEELFKTFSIKRVQKSGAIFDIKKLNWINSYYIKHLSLQEFNQYATNYLNKSNIEINKIIDFNLFCNYFQNKINNFKELKENYKMLTYYLSLFTNI